jgi:antitoxin HicB
MSEVILDLHIERLPEGVYVATARSLPGLVAQGRTIEEAVEIAQDVARKLIDSFQERNEPLPEGISPVSGSCDVSAPVGL